MLDAGGDASVTWGTFGKRDYLKRELDTVGQRSRIRLLFGASPLAATPHQGLQATWRPGINPLNRVPSRRWMFAWMKHDLTTGV